MSVNISRINALPQNGKNKIKEQCIDVEFTIRTSMIKTLNWNLRDIHFWCTPQRFITFEKANQVVNSTKSHSRNRSSWIWCYVLMWNWPHSFVPIVRNRYVIGVRACVHHHHVHHHRIGILGHCVSYSVEHRVSCNV